jgi:hypothetical protein
MAGAGLKTMRQRPRFLNRHQRVVPEVSSAATQETGADSADNSERGTDLRHGISVHLAGCESVVHALPKLVQEATSI